MREGKTNTIKIVSNLMLIMVLYGFFACKNKVEKIKPVVSTITESIYASGTIKSNQQYEAFATVNGTIEKVYLKEGDKVNIGTPILSIANELQQLYKDNAELAANYADINANQEKLKDAKQMIPLQESKMKNDLLLLKRQENLWQSNIGSKVELEQRELAYESSKTAWESAIRKYNDLKKQLVFASSQSKKNLEISNKQASDYTLKSEVNGIVYKLYKEKGEIVNPQTPLALIGNDKEFILEMQVDENDIFQLKSGQKVLVTMDSYKGKVFEAHVTTISPVMNERTKTFEVKAAFTTPPETLYPSITFEANIIIRTKEKALLIPRTCLLNDSTVVKSNGKKTAVKTGLKDYKMVEIINGLNLEDELIVSKK